MLLLPDTYSLRPDRVVGGAYAVDIAAITVAAVAAAGVCLLLMNYSGHQIQIC